jgi:hypothetical protein
MPEEYGGNAQESRGIVGTVSGGAGVGNCRGVRVEASCWYVGYAPPLQPPSALAMAPRIFACQRARPGEGGWGRVGPVWLTLINSVMPGGGVEPPISGSVAGVLEED